MENNLCNPLNWASVILNRWECKPPYGMSGTPVRGEGVIQRMPPCHSGGQVRSQPSPGSFISYWHAPEANPMWQLPSASLILLSQLWPVSLKHMALISGQVLMKINSGWYTDKDAGLLQSAIERTIRPCNARKLTHFSFIIWDQGLRNPLKLWIIKSFRHLIPHLWWSCAMLYNNILLFLAKATLASDPDSDPDSGKLPTMGKFHKSRCNERDINRS